MKTFYIILACIFCFLLFFNGCIVNIVGVNPAAAGTDAINRVSDQPSLIKLIAVGVLGIYEIIVRLVPSVGDYSAVSWFIKFLKKVSDTLNITKSG
jgi:hypothetical protein